MQGCVSKHEMEGKLDKIKKQRHQRYDTQVAKFKEHQKIFNQEKQFFEKYLQDYENLLANPNEE
jgi:hypothetical protein